MKLFIDSANIEEIKTAISWGMVDGATTNPSLMAKESGISFETQAKKICKMVPGPVSLEGSSGDYAGMLKQGRKLGKLAKNAVFKVPMTVDGLRVVQKLNKEKIQTNVTLVFSVCQALLAAKAGATFVSPFVGRLDDIGQPGWKLIEDIMRVYRNYKFKTKVIAASVRNTSHVVQSAWMGADIATIPFKVLEKMYQHSLTDKGIEAFDKDFKKLK